MNGMKIIQTEDNEKTCSIAKEYIGIPIIDDEGNLLNGEYEFTFGKIKALCRFVNGFLDGNTFLKEKSLL